uniref:Metalloendopeptidase n=1 Tax=Petromyzon marinus TaxID=7757 RepID=S4RRW5_PETMA
ECSTVASALIFNEYSRATFLVEADIMSPLTRNAIANLGFKWAKSEDGNVYIPYEMYNRYEPEQQRVIQEAMNEFNYRTCVRFVPRHNEADYLAFYPVMGCYSLMGHHRGMQIVSLDERCLPFNLLGHKVVCYVRYKAERCRENTGCESRVVPFSAFVACRRAGYEHNFNKEQTNNLDTPYDYGSLLHYNRYTSYQKNRRPTLVPTPETNVTLGQREKLSDQDVYKVNRFYACSKHL